MGLRCAKALHLALHRKDLKTRPDAATQARFDQGHEVGAKAREYFDSHGAVIQAKPWEYGPSLMATKHAMASDDVQTIYEAAFSDGTLYSRADILSRRGDRWRLIEVKEGTRVKEEHIVDVAIQALTMRRAGAVAESYSVMFLNKDAVYPDLSELFLIQDVTSEVHELLPQIEIQIDKLIAVSKAGREPSIELGEHCDSPYECSFKAYCWEGVPKLKSVFDLPRVSVDVAVGLYNKGVREIAQIPLDYFPDNALYERVITATRTGKRFVDREAIRSAVRNWQYPLHFLDFETVMPAIPRYEGTRPYAQIPYQFSCHVIERPGAELTHREYLHTATGDPREKLVSELCAAVADRGSVVSYYQQFERARMEELGEQFPQYASKLASICERLVDPLPIIREHVYDPEFSGSFSIKQVAPALLGADFRYDDKAVSDGLFAGVWADKILRGQMTGAAVTQAREKLLAYCRQDTLAMVRLWEWMVLETRI